YEPRNVHQREQWNAEGVAGADEAGGLVGGIDVQAATEMFRVVGDDAGDLPAKAHESDHQVSRERLMDLEKVAFIRNRADHRLHVVVFGHVDGNDVGEFGHLSAR